MPGLRDFAEHIVSEALKRHATSDVSSEIREQMIDEFESRANDYLNLALIEAMTDDSAERFNALLDEPTVTPEIVRAFIAANVENTEKVALQALTKFQRLYLGDQ